ncbi:MAG: LCP family protein [Chloroflexi bacterium]|nr:LCP family protein [Chloroflexota bacterium]
MERSRRPARPAQRSPLGLVAWLACLGLLASVAWLLLQAVETRRQLAALVVTPVPSPEQAGPAVALLSLPTLAPARSDLTVPATVLLLGADRRPGEEVTPRSDAILVLRLDPARRRVAVLSLPRDLWVAIPGHGYNRLNAAFLWGERDGPPGGGLALARATVAELLGSPVDYGMVADFRGFVGVVDALGGISVDVPRPLEDRQFPTSDRRVTTVRFAAGRQRMDGVTALTYARIRHPDSDFERGLRQQAVLLAIAERLRERGDLASLLTARRVSAALVGYVQTDMPVERMLHLAWALHELDPASVERYALSEADVRFGVENDRFAQVPGPGVLERYARLLLDGPEAHGKRVAPAAAP